MELRNIKTQYKVHVCEDKKKLREERKKLIDSFHFFDRNELRREALSHYQCVIEELAEEGFTLIVECIEDLAKDNETLILNDDLGLINRLMDAPKIIDILKEILMGADAANSLGDRVNQCLILRNGARQMLKMNQMKGWMWLIRRLLLISLGVSKLEILDGGFTEASSYYTYARFLWEYPNLQIHAGRYTNKLGYKSSNYFNTIYILFSDPKQDSLDTAAMDYVALKHLNEARNMSTGMVKWLIDEDNGIGERPLMKAICLLMRDIWLNEMYRSKDEGSEISERSYTMAVKRALESGDEKEYAETLTRVGDFLHFVCNKTKNALEYFNKALDIQKFKLNATGICDSLYSLSMALEKLGYVKSAAQHLKDMLTLAEDNNMITWQCLALRCLGERDLWSGQPFDASKKFIQAYRMYRNDLISQAKNSPSGFLKSALNGAVYSSLDKKSYQSNFQSFFLNTISEKNLAVKWHQSSPTVQKHNRLTIKEFKEKYLNSPGTVGYLSIRKRNTRIFGDKNGHKNILENEESTNAESVIIDTKSDNLFSNAGDIEHGTSSIHTRKLKRHHKKKKRSSFDLSDDDGNSDVDIRIQSDINLRDNIYSEDMDYLRCMCGISGGQEIIELYFKTLMQASTSMDARLSVIEWKLSRKPFWKQRTSMAVSTDEKTMISFNEPIKQ